MCVKQIEYYSIIKSLFYLISDIIPTTAKAIQIRNVQNPYIMSACEVEKCKETLYTIQEKLLNFMKTDDFLKGKYDKKDAEIGDVSFTVD